MRLNEVHLMNQQVLRHLKSISQRPYYRDPPIFIPIQHRDDIGASCHPDVLSRVWHTLGSSLPLPAEDNVSGEGFAILKRVDPRALVYSAPALVHPIEGVILAFCYSMQYVIRVPAESLNEALKAGCKTEMVWAQGGKADLKKELGDNWVFGSWVDDEERWLKQAYLQCADRS